MTTTECVCFIRIVYIATEVIQHMTMTSALPTSIKPSSSNHLQGELPTVHTPPTYDRPVMKPRPGVETDRGENTTNSLQKHTTQPVKKSTVWEADLNVSTEPPALSALKNQVHNLTLLTPTTPWKENHATSAFHGNVTPFSSKYSTEQTNSSSSLPSAASQPVVSPTPLPAVMTSGFPCLSSSTVSRITKEETLAGYFKRYQCLAEWTVHVPDGYGIVVEIHDVWMTNHDTLEIFALHGNSSILMRRFTNTSSQLNRESVSPLLTKDSSIHIIFSTPHDETSRKRISKFNLRNTAHPVNDVPVFFNNFNTKTESAYIYRCAGITNLPKVIMCDGIHHCQNGEDETTCAYRDKGCGDWFPSRNHCFKGTFIYRTSTAGGLEPTMPFLAAAACRSTPGATLASLQDPKVWRMALRMVHNSGLRSVVVGLGKVKPNNRRLKHLYRFIWQWGGQGGPIAYDMLPLQISGIQHDCAYLELYQDAYFHSLPCYRPNYVPDGYICMKENPALRPKKLTLSEVTFRRTSTPDKIPTKPCADGSVVQVFHRCQWGEDDGKDASGWSPNNLPLFQCRFGPAIHYSLLCDGKGDCADGSDETDCQKPQFLPMLTSSFICKNTQAVGQNKLCNSDVDCFDDSDEEACVTCGPQVRCLLVGCIPKCYARFVTMCPYTLYICQTYIPMICGSVNMNGDGMFHFKPAPSEGCFEGFYPCNGGHCIPTFLLNNGEQDCPRGEDEGIPAHSMICPGYYRCLRVGTCVHSQFICDGIYHCPYKDDEMFCGLTCPQNDGCVCEGQAYMCSKMIDPLQHLHVRYLDLSHVSNVSLENIHFMEYLFYLNISSCGLANVTLANMPHLRTLDLSSNSLQGLTSLDFHKLPGLRYLDVSNNPLVHVPSNTLSTMLGAGKFYELEVLIMGNGSLVTIGEKAFNLLSKLKRLDIRANPIHSVDKDSLFGLTELEELYTDESKLCCSYFHPSLSRCYAPVDELSSCTDLLAQDFLRVCSSTGPAPTCATRRQRFL